MPKLEDGESRKYQFAACLVKLPLVGLSRQLGECTRLDQVEIAQDSPESPCPLLGPSDLFLVTRRIKCGSPRHIPDSGGLKVGKKLYVGNLSFSVTDADLEDLFAPFGEVRSAQVVVDRQTGRSRGFGFVEMEIDAEALAAIDALHDHEHGGRRLTVNEAKPREDRGGGGGGGGGRGSYR